MRFIICESSAGCESCAGRHFDSCERSKHGLPRDRSSLSQSGVQSNYPQLALQLRRARSRAVASVLHDASTFPASARKRLRQLVRADIDVHTIARSKSASKEIAARLGQPLLANR